MIGDVCQVTIPPETASTQAIRERATRLPWQLRFFDSAAVVRDAAEELVRTWKKETDIVVTALYATIVSHYGQLFADSSSGQRAPEKGVRKEPGFDADTRNAPRGTA